MNRLVLTFLLGCSNISNVYIEPTGFTESEMDQIKYGVYSWHGRFSVVDEPYPMSVIISRDKNCPYLGQYNAGYHICVSTTPEPCMLHTVVAHELGHVAGLDHKEGFSIMYKHCDQSATIPTPQDIEEVK